MIKEWRMQGMHDQIEIAIMPDKKKRIQKKFPLLGIS